MLVHGHPLHLEGPGLDAGFQRVDLHRTARLGQGPRFVGDADPVGVTAVGDHEDAEHGPQSYRTRIGSSVKGPGVAHHMEGALWERDLHALGAEPGIDGLADPALDGHAVPGIPVPPHHAEIE